MLIIDPRKKPKPRIVEIIDTILLTWIAVLWVANLLLVLWIIQTNP